MSNRIYSKSRNPTCLVRFARWIGQQRRQFALYRFYRGLGHAHGDAWDKASRTL